MKTVWPDVPPAGTDWRSVEGYGWIFKAWFRNWGESRRAMDALREAGFESTFWGRKIRVHDVADGFEGARLVDVVLESWPDARIQLRND